MDETPTYTAFAGDRQVASGPLPTVLAEARGWFERRKQADLLIFDDETGREVDFDLRGTLEEVLARALPPPGPGRPRLGVVGREVSLLPRHWEWLEQQPNGISAAIRRLVDEARKRDPGKYRARALRDAAARFMTTMAGNRPGFEEALRALYAGDAQAYERHVRGWPADVRTHALRWAREAARLDPGEAPADGSRG